ncbi:class III lanthipeptide [Lysinibacillus sphaericus]|nr:class III lanthipeptide [Lysinibacillus sphaericus]
MNAVLELQKLAHDMDGKGQAVEITFTYPPPTVVSSVSIWICK